MNARHPRRHFVFGIALAVGALAQAAPALADPPGQSLRDEPLVFSVRLSDGHLYSVAGHLYYRGSFRNRTLQVLVHGATYDHAYWDIPSIDGHDYSYARFMAGRGYAVLAIDLPGTGASSRPDGDFFSLDEAASTVHQVVGALRSGANPTWYAFRTIALVGHSNGSVTSIYEQGTYHDADALVTTGWVHGCRPLPVDPSDPAFAAALANPYVSLPGPARTPLFYYAPFADPAVIDYDNAHLANPIPRHQFLDLLGVHADIAQRCADGSSTTLTRSQQVTGPVLVQAGEHDAAIAPGTIVNNPPTETSFYPRASSVTVQVLPDIGHAFNAHLTNEQGWRQIDAWLRSTLDEHGHHGDEH